jgi:hypothetical protein
VRGTGFNLATQTETDGVWGEEKSNRKRRIWRKREGEVKEEEEKEKLYFENFLCPCSMAHSGDLKYTCMYSTALDLKEPPL